MAQAMSRGCDPSATLVRASLNRMCGTRCGDIGHITRDCGTPRLSKDYVTGSSYVITRVIVMVGVTIQPLKIMVGLRTMTPMAVVVRVMMPVVVVVRVMAAVAVKVLSFLPKGNHNSPKQL